MYSLILIIGSGAPKNFKKNSKDDKSEGKFTVKTTSITTGAAKQKLFALDTGKTIVEFLNENFEKIMNYSFTANVEEQLDDIALGKFVWHEVIKGTYDCFQPQIELIRGKHKEGHKGKIKRFLGIDPVSNCDVSIIFTKKGPTIYMEIKEEKMYFLSRPRRFGKSLLISTLFEIFSGNKEQCQ